MIILLIVLSFILIFIIFSRSKKLKLPNVFLVTGGVKTGKSVVSVALAIKMYKKLLFETKLINFVLKILKKETKELPLLYSNIHLRNIKYTLINKDILERKQRINYKSVVLIDEVSLLADSMLYKDNLLNEKLMLFVKLFGHETHGGYLILNTQSIKDCHYAFKRCLHSYLWIHSKQKHLFFTSFKVRELLFSSENETSNNFNDDIEKSTLNLLLLNKYYKYYDCFCYSIFTDSLDVYSKHQIRYKNDSLKQDIIISFQNFETLKKIYRGGENDEK